MNLALSPSSTVHAESIRPVTADEAHVLLRTELERLLALIENLDQDDWSKPTACTAWSVRDILAHQAGGYASGSSYREMIRQYSVMLKFGRLPEDDINALQLGERAGKTTDELIAELKKVGPQAAHNWAYGFRLIKWLAMPHPIGGFMSLGYLMWITHSRDTWMHRLDICRATGRHFEQTRAHDGRINELVVRDVSKKLKSKLGRRAIRLSLGGIAGGTWQLGTGTVEAELSMDALDFNIFVSGRFSYNEALQRAQISGDQALVEAAFKNLLILY